MYTVVFADDEIELRQAILQRIDWAGLGFSVVADAENGVEALEAVEQYEPDLLITDIRMPLMTGIELARRVREVCPATQIVFLSGYDDFGYAQEAIRYNVISYLLKPISAAELSEELGHIRAKMDELMAKRVEKQPLDKPSAGSTFKRPAGAFAAALIDQCGLRGYRHGGAAVSDKHCGFVVNLGGATCADVLALCDEVRAIVKEKTGYDLEKEIRVVR